MNAYLLQSHLVSIDFGDWPSGKAMDSGSMIGGSNPSSPAKICVKQDLIA